MKKQILSGVMAVVIMISAFSIPVYADETEELSDTVQETETQSMNDFETEIVDYVEESEEETYEESIKETIEEETATIEETELVVEEDAEEEEIYEASGIFGDSLKWTLSSGTLTISGKGSMGWNYYDSNTYAPWDNYDTSITKVVIQSGVTDIMPLAFADTNVSSVSIPNTVKKIGQGAFANCAQLTKILIPSSVKVLTDEARNHFPGTFAGCIRLKEVNIPSSVTEIGWTVFYDCKSLTSITIPNSVTNISNWAFMGCINLTSITIPSSVEAIGSGAFIDCVRLGSIKIPSNTNVAERAFEGCTGLKTVTIGDNVTIGMDVFSEGRTFGGCTSLTKVSIGKNVKIENVSNFENCTSLKSFTIAGNAPSMNTNQFKNVPTSMNVYVPAGATGYNKYPWNTFKVVYGNSTKLIEDFVTRLYKVCLNRTPDSVGLKDWSTKLQKKQITGVEAAYGFIFSPEFKAKNLCNEDYVAQLYKAFLGRTADAAGKKDWVNKLNSGKTREEIFNGFALSQEFKGLCSQYGISQGKGISIPTNGTASTGKCSICGKEDGVTGFVTRLYEVCLNRTPDAGGLADWTEKLKSHKITGVEAAYGFFFSKEFLSQQYGDGIYVEYLYRALMGRESDKAGRNDWMSRLAYGWSWKDAFNGFAGSVEFSNICNSYGIIRGEVKLPSYHAKGTVGKSLSWIIDHAGTLTISGKGTMGLGDYYEFEPWYDFSDAIIKVDIKSGVTDIRECAFDNCRNLTSVNIPNTVTKIGNGAFQNCPKLRSIIIPEYVTDISAGRQDAKLSTFGGCSGLTSLRIPRNVKEIRKFQIMDCTNLETVYISKNTKVHELAFDGCWNLTSIIYY